MGKTKKKSEGTLNKSLLTQDSDLLQLWLRDMRDSLLQQVPPIVCKSGLKMSVQASKNHYCSPRNDVGPWTAVEVGFPSRLIPELEQYAGDWESPTNTVYGFVPIHLVEKIIQDNGGLGDE